MAYAVMFPGFDRFVDETIKQVDEILDEARPWPVTDPPDPRWIPYDRAKNAPGVNAKDDAN